jgi:hypothetical protein
MDRLADGIDNGCKRQSRHSDRLPIVNGEKNERDEQAQRQLDMVRGTVGKLGLGR